MGEKDMSEKILEDYNDVFSDIVNVLLFHGQELIEPSALESISVHSQYKGEDAKLHEQERDVAKKWKRYNVQLAIIGIENQTAVEKKMPFRLIGYDGASYKSQLQANAASIAPVVTIVLYFGEKHWCKERNIKSLMNIPKELDPYVNDYKMEVFEIAWLTDEQLEMFKSDFKVVARFFVNKRRNPDYVADDPTEIQHVDEVLKLLSVMTGDRDYENVICDEMKGQVKSMCDVAERLKNIGRQEGFQAGRSEGRSEGRLEGRSEGRSEERINAVKFAISLGASEEKILTQYSKEEYEKALALMKV